MITAYSSARRSDAITFLITSPRSTYYETTGTVIAPSRRPMQGAAECRPGHPVLSCHRCHWHPLLHILSDGEELLAGETPRPTQIYAPRPGRFEAGPGAPADVLPPLAGHVGRHAGQDVADEGFGRVGGGVQILRPLDLVVGQGAEADAAALQVVDRPHGLEVAPSQAVDGGNHQHVALVEPLVQDVPLVAAVVVLGP